MADGQDLLFTGGDVVHHHAADALETDEAPARAVSSSFGRESAMIPETRCATPVHRAQRTPSPLALAHCLTLDPVSLDVTPICGFVHCLEEIGGRRFRSPLMECDPLFDRRLHSLGIAERLEADALAFALDRITTTQAACLIGAAIAEVDVVKPSASPPHVNPAQLLGPVLINNNLAAFGDRWLLPQHR